jgi:hypothetical protein
MDAARKCGADGDKETTMKNRFFENSLAVIAAIVILIGVSAAATAALTTTSTAVEFQGFTQI